MLKKEHIIYNIIYIIVNTYIYYSYIILYKHILCIHIRIHT